MTVAHAEGGCYSTGQGPVMSCFEGNREVEVMKPFRHKNGNYYSWDHKGSSYCYKNAYGNQRCMQDWEARSLQCSEGEGRQLVCE